MLVSVVLPLFYKALLSVEHMKLHECCAAVSRSKVREWTAHSVCVYVCVHLCY
jgi:hypothetical protein